MNSSSFSSYFDYLPGDLRLSLFLCFNKKELYDSLPQWKGINKFRKLFLSVGNQNSWAKRFWSEIWRRDISSFLDLPRRPFHTYINIFQRGQDLVSEHVDKHHVCAYLAENGYDTLVYLMIDDLWIHRRVLLSSIEGGHIGMVEELLTSPRFSNIAYRYYEELMGWAGYYGHLNIVEYMIKLGANDYGELFIYAARNNHMHIVDFALKSGAINYNTIMRAMVGAAESGHLEMVNKMLELGANNYDEGMIKAAVYGHVRIVYKMLRLGATGCNEALNVAACNGHINLVRILISHGATDFNRALLNAVRNEHISIAKLILKKGADNVNEALYRSAPHQNKEMIKLLLDYGADNYSEILAVSGEEIRCLIYEYQKDKRTNKRMCKSRKRQKLQ
jgi:ribosomal protein L25 (general stress protein Ctc)